MKNNYSKCKFPFSETSIWDGYPEETNASYSLAQNYSAIRALATEGIQKGHMRLHARNLAAAAGATSEQIDKIVKKMIEEKKISLDRAKELLAQI